jgi:hypothetical protein
MEQADARLADVLAGRGAMPALHMALPDTHHKHTRMFCFRMYQHVILERGTSAIHIINCCEVIRRLI